MFAVATLSRGQDDEQADRGGSIAAEVVHARDLMKNPGWLRLMGGIPHPAPFVVRHARVMFKLCAAFVTRALTSVRSMPAIHHLTSGMNMETAVAAAGPLRCGRRRRLARQRIELAQGRPLAAPG